MNLLAPCFSDIVIVLRGHFGCRIGLFYLQDLQVIYYGLQGMEALTPYRDSVLRTIAKTARYERHEANDVLY